MADNGDEEYSDFESDDDIASDEDSPRSEKKDEDVEINKGNNFIVSTEENKDDEHEEDQEEEDDNSFSRPEIRLAKFKKEIVDVDFNLSRINRIKCIALCKIINGQNHWKVAEAHLDLANVYLRGKHYPLQTLKHANLSREILLDLQGKDNATETTQLQYLLQNLYYVLGRANCQLNKYKASENCLQKAKTVADNTRNATLKSLSMKVTILSSLAITLSKLGQLGQAIECIEEGIEVINKMSGDNSDLYIKLHKQMANLELMNGKHANFSSAEESVNKALKFSIETNGQESSDTAEIYILSCRVESQKEIIDFLKVETNLNEALKIYKNIDSTDKIIATEQMLCKMMMQQGKYLDATKVLEDCIQKCELFKGDMSIISAELYELMGSILFSQHKMPKALAYLEKAAEIYVGKKKHVKKQEKIMKIIDIIRKSSKDENVKTSEDKLKNRPRFH